MIESKTGKQATDAFMGLVEVEIDTFKQKLVEAEAKIRILQENAGALVDQKAELMEESARLKRDNERHLHAIEVLTGQIEKLQGMGIQQNTGDMFAELKHPSNVGLLKMSKNMSEEIEKRAAQLLNEAFAKIEKGS